ncbi:hypothetical protein [Patulibacter defluvii]|uniref:hypothetical protein n=1 Tax=Patulibacter defluvii TaxID=3095358 RepID=UPI002A761295|nr:hypothetical protein [Patulibacter sp. DM4]
MSRSADPPHPRPEPAAGSGPGRDGRWFARVGLPLALLAAAVVALIAGSSGLAGIFAAVAVIAFVTDRIIRLAIGSQRDRDHERAARRTLEREGHWPGEPSPPAGEGDRPAPVQHPRPRD